VYDLDSRIIQLPVSHQTMILF